jgi:hypothetical protein
MISSEQRKTEEKRQEQCLTLLRCGASRSKRTMVKDIMPKDAQIFSIWRQREPAARERIRIHVSTRRQTD